MTKPPPTVFVVDDDASVRKSLDRLLKSSGYLTERFPSADEFLERWNRNPVPGCLLLDILMPGLDGLQLQQQLQAATHGIQIIFITRHGDIPPSVKAIRAGAVNFFSKPFNDEGLFRRSVRPSNEIIKSASNAPNKKQWQSFSKH